MKRYVAKRETERLVSAKLIVRNFSCFKSLEVDFKRLTVFIGEQASGKSVTCKLFYFFTQTFRNTFAACLGEQLSFDSFLKKIEEQFHLIFPDPAWQSDTFSITWQHGNTTITVLHTRTAKKVNIQCDAYRKNYDLALAELNKIDSGKNRRNSFDEEMNLRLHSRFIVSKSTASLILPAVDYIPAGRSFFSTIQENVFALLSENIGIDYFLKEFGRKIEMHKFRFARHESEYSLRNFENILHGTYHYDGKEQWIIRDGKHKTRLADASSGQQEALPLLLILSRLLRTDIVTSSPRRVVIEEPEAHLFPTAQMEIVELLRQLVNNTSLGFVITTHSPFILCCLNNLITKSKSIRDSVSAYHLHDGIGEPLYDETLGLIDAKRFDDISTDIVNG